MGRQDCMSQLCSPRPGCVCAQQSSRWAGEARRDVQHASHMIMTCCAGIAASSAWMRRQGGGLEGDARRGLGDATQLGMILCHQAEP